MNNGKLRRVGISLQKGNRVRFGQSIGHIGMTSCTTGPHLHWGLRYSGRWLIPLASWGPWQPVEPALKLGNYLLSAGFSRDDHVPHAHSKRRGRPKAG